MPRKYKYEKLLGEVLSGLTFRNRSHGIAHGRTVGSSYVCVNVELGSQLSSISLFAYDTCLEVKIVFKGSGMFLGNLKSKTYEKFGLSKEGKLVYKCKGKQRLNPGKIADLLYEASRYYTSKNFAVSEIEALYSSMMRKIIDAL